MTSLQSLYKVRADSWLTFALCTECSSLYVGRNISVFSTFLPASTQEVHSRDPSEPGKSSLESAPAKRTWIRSWGGGSTSLVRAAVPIVAARCTWMWWSLRWWWWAPLEDPSGTPRASRVGGELKASWRRADQRNQCMGGDYGWSVLWR